jgi:hypothetical protein
MVIWRFLGFIYLFWNCWAFVGPKCIWVVPWMYVGWAVMDLYRLKFSFGKNCVGSHVIIHVGSHVIVHVDSQRGIEPCQNVDKPQRDTRTNLSATRGPFRARHVDKPQRDTWCCVKEPHHHIHVSTRLATSAASMGRVTWHPLPWPISWPCCTPLILRYRGSSHVCSSKFGLMAFKANFLKFNSKHKLRGSSSYI